MNEVTKGPVPLPDPRPVVVTPRRVALFALAVLFGMNLLNYVDRYVFAAVGPAIMTDLRLSSGRFGVLGSAFMIVYTLVSPSMGWLGDRYDRRRILTFGVGLWSVATLGTALATTFGQMFLARALLGVGEASYGVVAPTLLADLFSPRVRGRVMGIYFLALPIGTAIGYAIGGMVESRWGWHKAFLVVGFPGLVLAALGLLIRDPGRGASEGGSSPTRPGRGDTLALLRNRTFMLNTAGQAAVTFTIGAYGNWMPAFYELVRGMHPDDKLYIGAALAVGGIVGVLTGIAGPGFLARYTRRAYLIWTAVAVLASIPSGLAGLLHPDWKTSLALMFVASVFLTSCLGPCNAVTADVVAPRRRSAGFAFSILLLHLFGDIPSPPIIGYLADWLARPSVAASPLGRAFATIDALPVSGPTGPTNLTAGMLLIVPVLLLGSLCFFLGSRSLERDMDAAHRGE